MRAATVPPTGRAHLLAIQLLERHGVLTRAGALAEEVPGGFAAVYPVLRAMEEAGHARRGYFVAGLGGAQFALPGAVDRLRAMRTTEEDAAPLVLAAADPANPYGAALAWPETAAAGRARGPSRTAGAYVALVAGVPVAFLERGARKLTTFTSDTDLLGAALGAFGMLARDGRVRRIELDTVDGLPAGASLLGPHFEALGFVRTAKGFLLRPGQPATRPPRRMAR